MCRHFLFVICIPFSLLVSVLRQFYSDLILFPVAREVVEEVVDAIFDSW